MTTVLTSREGEGESPRVTSGGVVTSGQREGESPREGERWIWRQRGGGTERFHHLIT